MPTDLPSCETLKLSLDRGILHVTLDRPVQDARPQRRAEGEAHVVAEDLQRTPAVPGPTKRLQPVLHCRRKCLVGCVAVGDECVVPHVTLVASPA